jgi:hypothetical protein
MVPQGVVVVVLTLLLLAPGLVWELVLHRGGSRSPVLRRVCGVLLASVLCTLAGIGVMATVRSLSPSSVIDVGAWIRTDDYYFHRNYLVVVTTIVLTVGIGCLLAALCAGVMRHRGPSASQPENGWASVLTANRAPSGQPGPPRLVHIRTHAGTLYQGSLVAIDSDALLGSAALTLGGPIAFRRDRGDAQSMRPEWDRLVLPMQEVAELWIQSNRTAIPARDDAAMDPAADRSDEPDTNPDGGPSPDRAPAPGTACDPADTEGTTVDRPHRRQRRRSASKDVIAG